MRASSRVPAALEDLQSRLERWMRPRGRQRRSGSVPTLVRPPRVAAIGGGTGLSNLLRGLKEETPHLTAIVTVADDGGSSGMLRRDMGMIPPGDIRNCIVALANAEPTMTRLFQHRFDDDAGGISGHSFGNLFLAAMAETTGSMEQAIVETCKVLAVRGEILPSSLVDITLHARLDDGRVIDGESSIPKAGGRIEELRIEPQDAAANPRAVAALERAEVIVLGPGSLYTSILPNLLIPGLREALARSRALKIFIANVATQHGETDGLDAADHYRVLRRACGRDDLADIVLANGTPPPTPFPEAWRAEPVAVPSEADYSGAELVVTDLVDPGNRYRHHSGLLAHTIVELWRERHGMPGSRQPPRPAPLLSQNGSDRAAVAQQGPVLAPGTPAGARSEYDAIASE